MHYRSSEQKKQLIIEENISGAHRPCFGYGIAERIKRIKDSIGNCSLRTERAFLYPVHLMNGLD